MGFTLPASRPMACHLATLPAETAASMCEAVAKRREVVTLDFHLIGDTGILEDPRGTPTISQSAEH